MRLAEIIRHDGSSWVPREGWNLKVRYTHEDGKLKNTLLTTSDGRVILFGIARCNLSINDRFTKAAGKRYALERLLSLADFIKGHNLSMGNGLLPVRNQLSGWCGVTDARELIAHFEQIDVTTQIIRQEKYAIYEKARKERKAKKLEEAEKQEAYDLLSGVG